MMTFFTILITLQFAVIGLHDLIDIPGLNRGSQVRKSIGQRKVWIATVVNSIFPGIAVAFALWFGSRPSPGDVPSYWLIYCGIAVGSAVFMWYVPYFLGAEEKLKAEYLRMYEGTCQILPARHDNPRPNLFHVAIHLLFLVNFGLAALLRLTKT